MITIQVSEDPGQLDAALAAVPNHPAVFVLWPKEGAPHLSKTGVLRRRLLRLLRERDRPSRLLNLRHTTDRVEYQLTGSGLESSVVHYEQARRLLPETYLEVTRLRMPTYVRIVLSNEFPRSHVTTHLTRSGALHFGPFRSRASAERFEGQFLDLFQMRRCQEDLIPTPEHPGCMYGEMGMCLRPCQQVVGPAEYGHEIDRVTEFLRTDGRSLLDSIERSRDRLSEEMMFEEAARQHRRLEKVQEVLKGRDELVRDVDRLNGVAVTGSVAPEAVELWLVREGSWLGPRRLSYEVREGKPAPLDSAIREIFATADPVRRSTRERQEYLAILSRWLYSSWRDGEWLGFENYSEIPYRKLVNAVSRVARRTL